jgi:hypothetical protein
MLHPKAACVSWRSFTVSSHLMSEDYQRIVPDNQGYVARRDEAYNPTPLPEAALP